jgi:class 3 adenylate cyclase/tetratricopeptide (TPR) repeat protein
MRVCGICRRGIEGDFAFCPHCGAAVAAAGPGREQRRTVTVLFCDVTGSTALGESVDPEALRALLARYFQRMKAIVERHGGTVEKFIGDAVMAVFGVPVAHEDDALRAARAAAEMREVLPELGVQARIGLNTGEVVTGTAERLATGDAVNVAARLEQAAPPGGVLVGAPTLALLGEAVDVEPVEPLALKGKAEPVLAYRLLHVRKVGERPHEARFVGRERELALLRESWGRAVGERRCELVTVLGDAGVGKSRLTAEFVASIDARVVRARCLSYGDGITYWPVVEVLKQLGTLPPDGAAATAIRSLLGETDATASAEEIAWAFRKTLEHAARRTPLVVMFDDIQWGEESFLDLIEHVALLSSDVPLLMLCLARPELNERRPAWPVTLRLAPLGEAEVEELIPEHISRELRDRIARAAGGNPLFVHEMLAMAGEAEGKVIVPPTLQALLAARLDTLESAERNVLERGAVEGEIFHRGAVQALTPEATGVTPRLVALVRKELIRPERAQLPGDDGFRFRHLLIRDAAYDALPKATRAELHERFAAWLEQRGAALVELDEILGYHLEQASRYRTELGLDGGGDLTTAARRRLAAAGRRAQSRHDYGAAVSLLERAAALLSEGESDLPLELALLDALFWGGEPEDALRRADSLADRAAAAGDRIGELCGRIEAAQIRTSLDPEGVTEKLAALVEEALPVFEEAGDEVALYSAYRGLATVANMRAQLDLSAEMYERAAAHAERAGLPDRLVGMRDTGRFHGTTPVSQFLAWQDARDPQELRNSWLRGRRATALAMLGRFEEARAIVGELLAQWAELGGGGMAVGGNQGDAFIAVELLAGDPAAAVRYGEEGCRLLTEIGDQAFLSTAAGYLAQAYYALGHLDEADRWANRAAELGASDDALTQMLWRQAKAKVLARRGEHSEAQRLAREAVTIGSETEMLNTQADAYADLGEVLSLTDRPQEATAALEEALTRYQQKENLVMAGRTRQRLVTLRGGTSPAPTSI